MSQDSIDSTEISPNDALGKVLGSEHPGRVRGLGLGACPTSVFWPNSLRFSQLGFSSHSSATPSPALKKEVVNLRTQLESTLQRQKLIESALLLYLQKREGVVPEEFASVLTLESQVLFTLYPSLRFQVYLLSMDEI